MRYWKFLKNDGTTKSVQSCSNDSHVVPAAVEITEAEFDSYMASLTPIIPVPPVDWQAQWNVASPAERISVLARMLGIRP